MRKVVETLSHGLRVLWMVGVLYQKVHGRAKTENGEQGIDRHAIDALNPVGRRGQAMENTVELVRAVHLAAAFSDIAQLQTQVAELPNARDAEEMHAATIFAAMGIARYGSEPINNTSVARLLKRTPN